MRLFELKHNHDWRKSFHVTNINVKEIKFLEGGKQNVGVNKNDQIMIKAMPEYRNSVFFSLGWARASEWDEFKNAGTILIFDTEYLLDQFQSVLLKNDHLQHRAQHLEYFINDPSERQEYLKFIAPYRNKHSAPTFQDHPKLKRWALEAKQPTVEQYRNFIENELAIFGSNDIKKYLQTHVPYFEELLIQGKIPVNKALNIEDYLY